MPPVALTVTVVDPPKQAMVPADAEGLSAAGCVTVAVALLVQPLASVTVTVKVPAARPDSEVDVDPLVH